MARRWHLTPRQFEAKLERLCRTPTGAAGPAAERMLSLWRERRGARLLSDTPTILVVEDDETIQALIYHVLRDDFRVVVAGTAREGLELAHTEGPAAITLDLMLPDAPSRVIRPRQTFRSSSLPLTPAAFAARTVSWRPRCCSSRSTRSSWPRRWTKWSAAAGDRSPISHLPRPGLENARPLQGKDRGGGDVAAGRTGREFWA